MAEKEKVELEISEAQRVIEQMNEQNAAEKGQKMGELEAQLSGFQTEFAKKAAAKKAEQDQMKSHQKWTD